MEHNKLKEFEELKNLIELLGVHCKSQILATVSKNNIQFPIYGLVLGSQNPSSPTLGLFGGVHGLERVGSSVILSYLRTLGTLLDWDETLKIWLKHIRIVSIPIVNPLGMYFKTRSNPNGVDLMRNAPVDSSQTKSHQLYGGHRLGPWLSWYRGNGSLEIESKALVDFVRQHSFESSVSIMVDVHSGFGLKDQLWFPFAKTKKPFDDLASIYAIKKLLDQTYPNHVYKIEPQAKNYTTHGDLWDYLYELHPKKQNQKFLPLTLELGSFNWIKKNPFQLLFPLGIFNPIKPHRLARTMRRHLIFFDFLTRLLHAPKKFAFMDPITHSQCEREALRHWYG